MKMRRKMGRRITALFLVLLLGMNSLTAFASEPDTAEAQAEVTEVPETLEETVQPEEPEVSEPAEELTETEPVTEQETAPEEIPASEEKEAPEEILAQDEEEQDTETAVQYENIQETFQAEVSEEKEVPKVVKNFLDAVEKLAAFGNVTEETAEEFNRLGQAAMDAYEAVQAAGLEDFEGVSEALATLITMADMFTGGIETAALIKGEQFTVRIVKVVNGNKVDEKVLTSKCLQSTGHAGYNHSTNLRTLANQSGFSGYKGYNWSNHSTVPSKYTSGLCPNNNYASVHYNITGSAPYKADETLFLFFETSKTFTLKYNANGGTGAPATQTATGTAESYTFTVSSTKPERSGYNFLGWSTSSTAVSASYQPESSITVTGTTTLYAVWEKEAPKKPTLTGIGNFTIEKTFVNLPEKLIPGNFTLSYEVTYLVDGVTQSERESGTVPLIKNGANYTGTITPTIWAAPSGSTWDNMTWSERQKYKTVIKLTESNAQVDGYTHVFSPVYAADAVVSGSTATFTIDGATIGKKLLLKNTYTAIPVPKLSVTKTVDSTEVNAGDTVEYTIRVENKGEADAENVTVTDILDSNLTFESWSLNGAESTEQPAGGVYSVGTVSAGAAVVLTIKATVKDDVDAGTEISNTATADYDGKPEDEDPNDTVTVVVIEKPVQVTATWLDGYTETPMKQETVNKDISDEELETLYPDDPERESYEFTGWGEPVRDADGNITITAQWQPKTADVKAVHTYYDEVEGETLTIENGKYTVTAEGVQIGQPAPEAIQEEHPNYDGRTYICVKKPSDFTVTADKTEFEFSYVRTITATWLDGYTETPMKQETVSQDISNEELETLYPDDPERESYEFTGWGEPVRDADGNITITAQWQPKTADVKAVHTYYDEVEGETLTIENGKYTVTAEGVQIGQPAPEAIQEEHPNYDGRTYICVKKPSDFTVTADKTEFEFSYVRTITVTWLDEDGTVIKQEVIPNGQDYNELYPDDPSETGEWEEPVTDEEGNVTIQWKAPKPDRMITVNYITDDETPVLLQSKVIGTSYKDGDTYNCNDWIDESFDGNGHHYVLVKDSVNDPGNGTVNGDILITAVYTADPTPVDPTPTDPADPTPVDPTPADPTPAVPVTPVIVPTAPVITPAVTPVPVVTPAVTPEAAPVTPVITPAAAAAEQPEIRAVQDEDIPLSNTKVEDAEVPLAGSGGRWALVNFALMNLSIFESLMLLIGYFVQTKRSKEEDEEEDEKERKLKKKGIVRLVSLPVAVISIIAFFLTENIWLPTKLVDEYTLLMAVIAVIQTVVVALSRKEEDFEAKEEEPEAEMA